LSDEAFSLPFSSNLEQLIKTKGAESSSKWTRTGLL